MAAPTLKPLDVNAPLGTPAAEWAQQTVDAIGPGARTGLVTGAHGNPTTDHNASALGGAPGHGVNADKTGEHMQAVAAVAPKATEPIPLAQPKAEGTEIGNGIERAPASGVFTDAQGNPTTNPNASALEAVPGASSVPPYLSDRSASAATTQLPGGWIRSADSRQNSMAVPETSLYEDVSAALGTVGQAAFSALPASVIGNLSSNPDHPAATKNVTTSADANGTDEPKAEETKTPPSPPQRSGSPGILSRAQGMLSGFLARPASPAAKLPSPDAPTTTGEAALVGGGAVAGTANALGDSIASGQNLGGHDPKGVLEGEQRNGDPNLLSEGTARRTGLPVGANTASKFLDPNVATPDPDKPPVDPGLSGSVFPVLADDPMKDKAKSSSSPSGPMGSTVSPDHDVQAAVRGSNQNFSSPIPTPGVASTDSKSGGVTESDRPTPTVTKVSEPGVVGRLLDAKDVVAAPFAGSRAPKSPGESQSPGKDKLPSPGPGVSKLDQNTKTSANSEGIRTTENPHTAHTSLAPPREEGTHIGGTGVVDSKTSTGGQDRKNLDGTTALVGDTKNAGIGAGTGVGVGSASGEKGTEDIGDHAHLPGVSTHDGGKIVAHEDGSIKPADAVAGNGTATGEKDGAGKGLSKLWSRSRTSVEAGSGRRRASVDDVTKSPSGSRRNKPSRFNEDPTTSTGSDAGSTPGSPTSSRIKVPFKDKIKGELKIISGKMSKNEAKVEEGIALKTGHPSEGTVTSPK